MFLSPCTATSITVGISALPGEGGVFESLLTASRVGVKEEGEERMDVIQYVQHVNPTHPPKKNLSGPFLKFSFGLWKANIFAIYHTVNATVFATKGFVS